MYETDLTDEPVVVKTTRTLKPILAWDWPLVVLLGLLALADLTFVVLWALPANRGNVGLLSLLMPLAAQVALIYSLATRQRGARAYVMVLAVLTVTLMWLAGGILVGELPGGHDHSHESEAEHAAHTSIVGVAALITHMAASPLLLLAAILSAVMSHKRK